MGLGDLSGLAAPAVYLSLFVLVFVESGLLVGFFLPGDTVLFAAGLLAADPSHHLSVPVLVAVVLVAAVSGDALGYWLGHRYGRPYLSRRDNRVVNPQRLAAAEAFYQRWGPLAVVGARWIPWVRTLTPVLAGVSRMPYRRFLPANILGAVTWGAGLVLLGRLAAQVHWVRTGALAIGVGFAVLFTVPLVLRGLRQRRAHRRAGPRTPEENDAVQDEDEDEVRAG